MSLVRGFVCVLALAAHVGTAAPAEATEWFVALGSAGTGTSTAPFGTIQQALNVAQPGDVVTVRPGTYKEAVRTVRSGSAGAPIRLRAEGARGTVVVTMAATGLRVSHAYFIAERLVIDGQYAAADTVLVASTAHYFTLRDSEVRRSTRDLIDIGAPQGVLIEGSSIHHALNAAGGRTDAHGIVAGAVRDLTVRDTDIHTFSGDGLQVDPGRAAPGWNNVTIEKCRIWLTPLPAAENGFAAGVVPGENAIDTKANTSLARATLTIRDTTAWGFRKGLIGNMAAFNLKENIDATVDRVTVYDSEIAFRTRGPAPAANGAWVTIKNAVVYSVLTAFRYEDNIEQLKIWNSTVGGGVTRAFQAASSNPNGLDVRNLLVLGALPSQASHSSNKGVAASAFVNAAAHNYMLAASSPAIDAGVAIAAVPHDRQGTLRPQGAAYDVGAFELAAPDAPGDPADIVIHAASATTVHGAWQLTPDATAASGARLWHPDANTSSAAQAQPMHYFEVTVWAEANKEYRLWLRGKADKNWYRSDAVWVQFSSSIKPTGTPTFRIGTTSAVLVNIEDCPGCGLSGWGWQDTQSGLNVLGPLVRFATTGPQTIRVQTKEDGVSIDQIVLSSATYLTAAPGATKNDTTILPES
jgi:hypothetical protein